MEETRDYMRATDLRFNVAFPIWHDPRRWRKSRMSPEMLSEFVSLYLDWKQWYQETGFKLLFGFDEVQGYDRSLTRLVKRAKQKGLNVDGIPPSRVGDPNYPQRDVGAVDQVLGIAKWGLILYAGVNLALLASNARKKE